MHSVSAAKFSTASRVCPISRIMPIHYRRGWIVAAVDLGHADLSLFTDPINTRVEIPFLTAFTPQVQPSVALVRFEGNTYPTAFRGEGVSRTMSLSMIYPFGYHAEAREMLELLTFAHGEAADGRLQLRTNAGRVSGLDPLEIVIVTSWADVPQVGLYRTFSVEATRVHATLGV